VHRVATGVAVAAEALDKLALLVGEVDDGAGEPGRERLLRCFHRQKHVLPQSSSSG